MCGVALALYLLLPLERVPFSPNDDAAPLSICTDTGRPADGSTPVTVHYPLWALIIVFITIGIGVICAIICLVVTLAYRKHKLGGGCAWE